MGLPLCLVILVTLCGLVTECSCNSLLKSQLSEFEKQGASLKVLKDHMLEVEKHISGVESQMTSKISGMNERLGKMEDNIESINDALVKLVSALLENKPEEVKNGHAVDKRAVVDGNPLTDLPDDLSKLIGAPGKDGSNGLPGKDGEAGGAVYTRWGRTTCGSDSTLLYAGYAGGSNYHQTGGGTNLQCMPLDPRYNKHHNGVQTWYGSYMAGVEYETYNYGVFPGSAHQQNVPCARCYTNNRSALMMIPAKRDCAEGWNKEYEGYLMAEYYNYNHQTTFECVDEAPEYVKGEGANDDGGVLYFIRTQCDRGGHCPPYDDKEELTCVVCSK